MGLPCKPLNKSRSFRKFRNFGRTFPGTLWIYLVDFVSGMFNYRKFRSFCKFRNFHDFPWAFPATLWINFVDFVSGMANYRKFRSFRKFRNFRNSCNFGPGLSMGLPCNPLNVFRWFCFCLQFLANYRKFRNSCNFGRGFPATFWINCVDFFHGLTNYRKFRSFRKFCNFRNSCNFGRGFPATLWTNYKDFVNGLANCRKFRSFRTCVQSWTLLVSLHLKTEC